MLNEIKIIGHSGEVHSKNGVVRFSVATNSKWTDKKTGLVNEKTEWHKVVCFGELAVIVGQYLEKGKQVMVNGRMEYSTYTASNGQERDHAQIVADKVLFLGKREQNKTDEAPNFETTDEIPF